MEVLKIIRIIVLFAILPRFFDGQSGKTDDYCSNVYWKLLNLNGGLTLARLDNAEIKYDGIKRLLE